MHLRNLCSYFYLTLSFEFVYCLFIVEKITPNQSLFCPHLCVEILAWIFSEFVVVMLASISTQFHMCCSNISRNFVSISCRNPLSALFKFFDQILLCLITVATAFFRNLSPAFCQKSLQNVPPLWSNSFFKFFRLSFHLFHICCPTIFDFG